MTALYTWDGRYCGFIRNGYLFDTDAEYRGWVDNDGDAFDASGNFIGELVDENYILRRTTRAQPARRAPRATPARPSIPARRANRVGRARRASTVDALAEW